MSKGHQRSAGITQAVQSSATGFWVFLLLLFFFFNLTPSLSTATVKDRKKQDGRLL